MRSKVLAYLAVLLWLPGRAVIWIFSRSQTSNGSVEVDALSVIHAKLPTLPSPMAPTVRRNLVMPSIRRKSFSKRQFSMYQATLVRTMAYQRGATFEGLKLAWPSGSYSTPGRCRMLPAHLVLTTSLHCPPASLAVSVRLTYWLNISCPLAQQQHPCRAAFMTALG